MFRVLVIFTAQHKNKLGKYLIITKTAGAAASPQRPAAVILTTSFRLRLYEYMLGVVAVKVSKTTLSLRKGKGTGQQVQAHIV